MLRRLRSDDRGETLLELVVAITILGVCVVALGSAIVLSVKTSAIHRAQATADAFLHNYAETLQSSYAACPNYASQLVAPSGFQPPSVAVKSWDATAQNFSGPACADTGLQQVTLTLNSTDGYVSESLLTVVRKSS
jgi:type II secretory pathway pseudopilin PulG